MIRPRNCDGRTELLWRTYRVWNYCLFLISINILSLSNSGIFILALNVTYVPRSLTVRLEGWVLGGAENGGGAKIQVLDIWEAISRRLLESNTWNESVNVYYGFIFKIDICLESFFERGWFEDPLNNKNPLPKK